MSIFFFRQGAKNGVMPLHNEYFCNAEEGQKKAVRWVGYILPVPFNKGHLFLSFSSLLAFFRVSYIRQLKDVFG